MKSKIDWQNHIFEFITVTFGILLAFSLNNWNENRNEILEVGSYLEGIKEEMLYNQKELEEKLPYHQNLLNVLETKPLEANLVLRPPDISNIAWRLSENNIFKKHCDRSLYRKLARLYYIHNEIVEISKESSSRMSEMNIFAPFYLIAATDQDPSDEESKEFLETTRQSWIPIFETWTVLEQEYLNALNQLLEEI